METGGFMPVELILVLMSIQDILTHEQMPETTKLFFQKVLR